MDEKIKIINLIILIIILSYTLCISFEQQKIKIENNKLLDIQKKLISEINYNVSLQQRSIIEAINCSNLSIQSLVKRNIKSKERGGYENYCYIYFKGTETDCSSCIRRELEIANICLKICDTYNFLIFMSNYSGINNSYIENISKIPVPLLELRESSNEIIDISTCQIGLINNGEIIFAFPFEREFELENINNILYHLKNKYDEIINL